MTITMTAPVGPNVLDTPNGLVGRPMDRVDGPLKVTGRATYAYEYHDPAHRAAYGYVVQSPVSKARITGIDSKAAEQAPGVLLVLTYQNAFPQESGDHRTSCAVLNTDSVTHYGEPVALVVAETFEQARAGAYLVKLSYDQQHGEYELARNLARAQVPQHAMTPPDSEVGDFADAFAKAPVKLDVTYTTPLQSHAMMEPHATLAEWDGDNLVLYTANQMLDQGRRSLAHTLKMPADKIRLVSRYIGGGFGAKLWVNADAVLAAMAARKVGRPVKVALTRQQVFSVTTHRSDTIQHVRLGADQDGRLIAIGHDVYSGNLAGQQAYEAAANQTRTLYAGANRQTRHRLVPLDTPIASSMRAPGEAVGLLALECAMDELAARLDIDPIELRIRNEPTEDPEKKIPYSTRNLIPCLRAGAERFGWDKRNPRPGQVRDGRWLVGLGVAAATRQNPLQNSSASVRLDPNGIATVRMAMTDLGTGTYTILTQIAAEMLGLKPEQIRMELGDTNFPQASGSGGSFGAASSGSALFDACSNLKAKLAASGGVGPDGLEATGEIKVGDMEKKYSQQSYGAQFAEVGVDRDTGEIRLRRMLGVFTAGRILNAKTARSQAIGGMTFGVGAALEEMVALDPRFGSYVNHDLAEYHVPVHADIPDLDAFFLPEIDDKTNPLKSKGVGELGICGAGAAVANAVYNACGVRIRDYPLTLDKVIGSLPV
jgi:xanthine dehydrogenase YagR molybdenum-binding subunit